MVQIDIPATPEDPAEAKQYEMKTVAPGTVVEWEIGKHQYASVAEYIETLERAVLLSFVDTWQDGTVGQCWHCRGPIHGGVPSVEAIEHTPTCIVPAFLEKYAE